MNVASVWLLQTSYGTAFFHEVVQEEFRRVLTLAKLDVADATFTVHSARHTFAMCHILAGKPAKWVSGQLGHKDVTVTVKIYARWFQMLDATAGDERGERLLPSTDGNANPGRPLVRSLELLDT